MAWPSLWQLGGFEALIENGESGEQGHVLILTAAKCACHKEEAEHSFVFFPWHVTNIHMVEYRCSTDILGCNLGTIKLCTALYCTAQYILSRWVEFAVEQVLPKMQPLANFPMM